MTRGSQVLVDTAGQRARTASLDLTGSGHDSLARVRRWIASTLTGASTGHLDDVILVADELTSNAFEHGEGPLGIHLTHRRAPCRTTVEVTDRNQAELMLGESRFGPTAHRGRGLVIVDRTAQAWGVHTSLAGGTKTVWARITA